ncbi:TPA: hypothetical protein DEB00_00955 [Candidatus Uhrbacteria bacterium]|nr:hypothetical protein [Candidatus Uhrbacteria bacterium]
MLLMTQLVEKGIRIAVTVDVTTVDIQKIPATLVPSELYLREIELAVALRGGWKNITNWLVSTDVESFTSVRGLIALVNTLAPLHGVPVRVFKQEVQEAEKASLPLEPLYSAEPNISQRGSLS